MECCPLRRCTTANVRHVSVTSRIVTRLLSLRLELENIDNRSHPDDHQRIDDDDGGAKDESHNDRIGEGTLCFGELKENNELTNLKLLEEDLLGDHDACALGGLPDDLISGFHGLIDLVDKEVGYPVNPSADEALRIDHIRSSIDGFEREKAVCNGERDKILATEHLDKRSVEDEDIEEGQIANDFQSLKQPSDDDEVDLCKFPSNDPKLHDSEVEDGDTDVLAEFRSTSGGKSILEPNLTTGPSASGLPDGKLADKDKGMPVETKDAKATPKKRGTKSKAKKKEAKKRKRAQKEREQGVKRLRLQPVTKPKIVNLCNFYLKGRCLQGDKCKFSHHAVPLTKSTPCKHFALGNCMKGEDCPYDHQLSKYPCHNFSASGSCIRGDKCKFSHEIPAAQSSYTPTVDAKSAASSSSEKLNLKKDASVKGASCSGVRLSNNTTSSTQRLERVYKEQSLLGNTPKSPVPMPKGVRVISFGKESSDKNIMQHGTLPNETNVGVKIGNQGVHFSALKCSAEFQPKSVSIGKVSNPTLNGLSTTGARENTYAGEPFAHPNQLQESDGTKLLEEFLFGNCS